MEMTVREEIEQLKKEKNAVILAHYYARPEGYLQPDTIPNWIPFYGYLLQRIFPADR